MTKPSWTLEAVSPWLELPYLALCLVHFMECSGHLGMPIVQRQLALASFTFDLGTPLLQSHDIQNRAPERGPQPSRPSSSLLFQFRFSSFRPVLPPTAPCESPTPACTALLRACQAGPSPARTLLLGFA